MEKFGYSSPMQAPRLRKIVLNMGVGDALTDVKLLDAASNELQQIAGQKPAIRRSAEVDRELQAARGPADWLHGHVARRADVSNSTTGSSTCGAAYSRLPRVEPAVVRRRGNYTMGLTEQIIFPEIQLRQSREDRGMDVTIVTSGEDRRGGA